MNQSTDQENGIGQNFSGRRVMEAFSGKCRKHRSSNKQPGICSFCLRDRLLQLADAYNTLVHNYTDGAADRRFSSSTSTASSPPPMNKNKHVRQASSSDAVRSISYVIGGGGELKKSRSIAGTMMCNKRGGSFWKKLLMVRGMDQVQLAIGKPRTLKDGFDD